MSSTWYFARHKQKLGPFSWSQLQQLATFGLLQRADHILEDGTARWREARSVAGLFPAEQPAREYRLAIAGQSCGPFSGQQVRTLLLSGRLPADTMVNAGGTTKWAPLSQLPEFAGCEPPTGHSQAVLAPEPGRGLSKEEAELYLAGKEGDAVARLIARLMEMQRKYADNASLEQSLNRNIRDLKELREQSVLRREGKPAERK